MKYFRIGDRLRPWGIKGVYVVNARGTLSEINHQDWELLPHPKDQLDTKSSEPEYLHDVDEWESRKLGADAAHAKPTSADDEREMDEALRQPSEPTTKTRRARP